jgi:hypothetical protein
VSRKKVSTTVYLRADQVVALNALHLRTKIPVAEMIRDSIDAMLEQQYAAGAIERPDPLLSDAPMGLIPVEQVQRMIDAAVRRVIDGHTAPSTPSLAAVSGHATHKGER